MQKPKFIFTAYQKSFKVLIENLEKLSVEQIQEIENFVSIRKGVFDFNTYTFVIQKKIEFEEFTKLLSLLSFNAITINCPLIKKEKKRVSFGQYKGMYFDELPDSYLLWLKSNYHGTEKKSIEEELKHRKL